LRPIRYIGRNRNAGYGHSLFYRIQMELALYVPGGYIVAPYKKKLKWERDHIADEAAYAAVEREVNNFERMMTDDDWEMRFAQLHDKAPQ